MKTEKIRGIQGLSVYDSDATPTVCTVRLSRCFVTENLAEWLPAIMHVGLVISSAGKIKMNTSQIFFGISSVYDSDANCLYGTSFAIPSYGKPRLSGSRPLCAKSWLSPVRER